MARDAAAVSRAEPVAARALRVAAATVVVATAAAMSAETAYAGVPAARSFTPTSARAFVARVVVATAVRERPGAGAVESRLGTQAEWTGGPVSLLVLDGRPDSSGDLWLKVRLATRPNDASGWIDADHASVTTTPWRVVVRTGSRRVSVLRAGRRVRFFRAVVGKRATPTPRGLFAIAETDRQPRGGGFLGPWALHLTAHSTVLKNYGGGPGRVAIHGRGGASLRDPLGTARSHGCVRVDNRHVIWMARVLKPGTPVRVMR